jgi:tRNA (guanine37-N1)-methyltransferase
MNFHVVTLFPELIHSYCSGSIIGKAQDSKKIRIKTYNPRDFSDNKWNKVDDTPYGGGPGMVMMAEPVIRAIQKAKGRKRGVKIFWLSPSGEQWTNDFAMETVERINDLIIVCGRYEGIDARVKEVFDVEEVSMGPYTVTGGELPALTIIDSISRRVPGTLGDSDSVEENRTASPDVYTRPESFTFKRKKFTVPDVLTSGDHKKIEQWRRSRRSKQ